MSSRIVLISPDAKLAEKAQQVIKEISEDIDVIEGSYRVGLRYAKEVFERGASIIISRGGTGQLIKSSLPVPVVEVEISTLDMLSAINQAINISTNIGILGFRGVIGSAQKIIKIMSGVFPAKIITEILHNETDVHTKALALIQKKVGVIICGHAFTGLVEEKGCYAVPLESGRQAVIDAIRKARHLLAVQLEEKEKAEVLKSIIDFTYSGIVGIDAEGKITVLNSAAEKLIACSAHQAIGKPVNEVIENTIIAQVLKTGEAEIGQFQTIGQVSVATNRVPIIVDGIVRGAVVTFEDIEKLQSIERQIRKKLYLRGHVAKIKFHDIIGSSKLISHIKNRARQFAKVDSTVLIVGETGTGKELFAQSIHNASLRADKPFVAVNCAVLPENLLESELFGYVEGAFTGAKKGGKPGLFELAHSGTIFLDEVSEMSTKLQARLLRVIQEKEVAKIGDNKVIPVDIRIIAASNRNLNKLVEEGKFRDDLYYRLCVLQLSLPPLRERREDIASLAKYFINKKGAQIGKKVTSISVEAINLLMLHNWPGNVRQLENCIEKMVVLCEKEKIEEDLVLESVNGTDPVKIDKIETLDVVSLNDPSAKKVLKQMEYEIIRKVLVETNGNKALAAKKLGISPSTIWRKLKSEEAVRK
jgi:PAS domain S-box-containing protein